MNQSQHDELAELFRQNMQVSQQVLRQQQHTQSDPSTEQISSWVAEKQRQQDEQRIHYTSTHYTPTAHVQPIASSSQRPQAEIGYDTPEAMAHLLRQHGIDPCALLPNQCHLFEHADGAQRQRLLELWKVAPPSYPLDNHLSTGTWISTSMERETELARMRYEQQQHQITTQQEQMEMLDSPVTSDNEPLTPIRDAREPAWPPAARMRAASIAASRNPITFSEINGAEQYIVNGYAASKGATDPVYDVRTSMEDQYGMLEQIRCHADWEAMNERIARERMGFGSGVGVGDDEDMEL